MNYTNQIAPTSEENHIAERDHFTNKVNWRGRRKMDDKERGVLKTRIANYPNKNHAPVPPNN